MINKFRNASHKLFTQSLFYETATDKSTVIYTLKPWPHEGFPSLYQIYMDIADPAEYRFAKSALDGWDHFLLLSSLDWFKPHLSRWRAELSAKLHSESIAKIREIAGGTGRDSLTAAKTVIDLVGGSPSRSKAGRPPKDQEELNRSHEALQARLVAEDVFRLQKELN